ncbi:MAG TPA: hypothetical protein VEC12_03435 [Bacteroidia bacterium]|nr:hypothetical protein [Bacteroidia bacterium]
MRISITLFFAFLIVLNSCKKSAKVTDAVSYLRYIENKDNGLVKEYKNEEMGLQIKVQYKSPVYMAIKEFDTDNFQYDSMAVLAQEYDGAYHFGFKISSAVNGYDVIKAKLPPKEYLDRITYLSTEVSKDFKLVLGLDTLPCSICHFERTFNISPHNEFILVFPGRITSEENAKLIYDDKIFGIGKLEFDFKRKHFKNIPDLI